MKSIAEIALGSDPQKGIENALREIAVQVSRIPPLLGELRGDIQTLSERLEDVLACMPDET